MKAVIGKEPKQDKKWNWIFYDRSSIIALEETLKHTLGLVHFIYENREDLE